jgi:hypothetical protein
MISLCNFKAASRTAFSSIPDDVPDVVSSTSSDDELSALALVFPSITLFCNAEAAACTCAETTRHKVSDATSVIKTKSCVRERKDRERDKEKEKGRVAAVEVVVSSTSQQIGPKATK